MKGQVRTSPPQFLENELVIPSLDGYGRLQTSTTISGGASETEQIIQTGLLESIELQTKIGAGWFPKRFHKLLLTDMTVSGIDLTAITPAGMSVVSVIGSRSTLNAQTIYLEAQENDPGVFVDLDFGRNYVQSGTWKTIGPLTTNGCFPLWVVFS